MTCTRPDHNIGRRCTKEISIATAKSVELARRYLKAWVWFGAASDSEQSHRTDAWKLVFALGEENLPSEEVLDAEAIMSWDKYATGQDASDFVIVESADIMLDATTEAASQGGSAGTKGRHRRRCGSQPAPSVLDATSEVLGGRLSDTPADVHKRMVEMAQGGMLPMTTPAQRARQTSTPGSGYAVPLALREALKYRFIGPNLPPPRGLVWRCRGSRWALCKLGG